MDTPAVELLSRLLDGDLDRDEAEALIERFDAEPELAAELDAMRRLRQAIAEISDDMTPPKRLDQLMEPLRRGAPVSRSPTWLRVLAAAAAGVLGVTLVVEVGRHRENGDGGAIQKLRQATPSDPASRREIFRLQPLPTSTVPQDEVRIGAADRLVARPVPEPVLDEPRPLDIVGPLAGDPAAHTGGTLAIASADPPRVLALSRVVDLEAGRYEIRITVEGGRVSGVRPVDRGNDASEGLQSTILGIIIGGGLEDGEYPAELTITTP